jgi:hypothetical protein
MAKKDDGLVVVIAGARFKHNGRDVWANDIVRMTPAEAADLKALHFVRDPKPGELASR